MRNYWAFISYSHSDEKWASWLHRKLEGYRGHKKLVGTINRRNEPVPQRLFPIFRDRDELEGAPDLPERLRESLAASRYLIVVCSPRAAKSRWVDEEIRAFKALKGENAVLALIVSGEPNASDTEQECFPQGLRFRTGADGVVTTERTEPLAADARKDKDGPRVALLKLASAILGVSFDDLRQRDAQRRMRLMTGAVSLLSVITVVILTLALYAFYQEGSATAARLAAESRFEADKRYDLALLTAVEAVRLRDNPDTRSALLSAVVRQPKRVAQLLGHTRAVGSLAFSPDGSLLASGSADKGVMFWDVSTRKRSTLKPIATSGEVTSLAFGPSGKSILVANRNQDGVSEPNSGEFSIWNVGSETRESGPLNTKNTVWTAAFASGHEVLMADGDGRAALWDLGRNQTVWESVAADEFAGFNVVLSSDGNWLATGGTDGDVTLISLKARSSLIHLPKVHAAEIVAIAFSKNGTLATMDEEGEFVFWDVETKKARQNAEYRSIVGVTKMVFSPDGKHVALGCGDGSVFLRDSEGDQDDRLITGRGDRVTSLSYSPNGGQLAVGVESGNVLLADLRKEDALVRSVALPSSTWGLAFKNSQTVLVATDLGLFEIPLERGSAGSGKPLLQGFLWQVASTSDGKTYAVRRTCADENDPPEEVVIIDADDRTPPRIVTPCRLLYAKVAFHPDGNVLAIGRFDGAIEILSRSSEWRAQKTLGTPNADTNNLKNSVDALSFSPDGTHLAAGHRNGELNLWEWNAGTKRSWKTETHSVDALTFRRDGKLLATGDGEGTVRLWDVASGMRYGNPLVAHKEDIESLSFSPDGSILATASGDNTVLLWDVALQRRLGEPLETHDFFGIGQLRDVGFSPDGQYLITVGSDSKLFAWDLRLDTWFRHACYVANRGFTAEEWSSYGSRWKQPVCSKLP